MNSELLRGRIKEFRPLPSQLATIVEHGKGYIQAHSESVIFSFAIESIVGVEKVLDPDTSRCMQLDIGRAQVTGSLVP